jgi:hypothetical protein
MAVQPVFRRSLPPPSHRPLRLPKHNPRRRTTFSCQQNSTQISTTRVSASTASLPPTCAPTAPNGAPTCWPACLLAATSESRRVRLGWASVGRPVFLALSLGAHAMASESRSNAATNLLGPNQVEIAPPLLWTAPLQRQRRASASCTEWNLPAELGPEHRRPRLPRPPRLRNPRLQLLVDRHRRLPSNCAALLPPVHQGGRAGGGGGLFSMRLSWRKHTRHACRMCGETEALVGAVLLHGARA